MNKKQKATIGNPAQLLLDGDLQLRAAADTFSADENDETTDALRRAALAFAEAWHACEGAGR